MQDDKGRTQTTDPVTEERPNMTWIESDYLATLAKESGMFQRLRQRAARWPHEKLRTAIAAVLSD